MLELPRFLSSTKFSLPSVNFRDEVFGKKNRNIKNKSIRAPIKSSDIDTEIILKNKQEEGRKLKEDKEEKEEKEENLKPNGETHLNNINDILSNNDKDSVINSYNQNLKNEEENETKEEIKEETKKEIEEEIKIKVNNDLNKEFLIYIFKLFNKA